MSDPEVVVRLLAAIDEREAKAAKAHDERCGLTLGTITGNVDDECDCGIPADLRRLCQSHRDIVAAYQQQQQIADQLEFEQQDSDAHMTAVAIVLGLASAVTFLARGHGVEDGETK